MAKTESKSHENYDRHETIKGSSNRSFGIVFCVFFAVLAAIQLYADHIRPAIWFGAASAVFLLLALIVPRILAPLNFLWTKLGLLLHSVMNPLILGMIFFLVCTPMGIVMRLFGLDPLKRKFDREADSYWIDRDEPGPKPETMINQF